MPRYGIQYRASDGVVVGVVAITDASAVPEPIAGTAFELVTEAQWLLARQVRLDTFERVSAGTYRRIREQRAFARLDGDGYVIGLRFGPGTAAASERQLTDAEAASIKSGLRHPAGGWRWRFVADALAEVPDDRPVLVFTPSVVDARVGDSPVGVLAKVYAADGTTPLAFTGEREIETSAGTLALSFSGGEATITVPTSRALEATIASQSQFRTDGLRVRVLATGLE